MFFCIDKVRQYISYSCFYWSRYWSSLSSTWNSIWLMKKIHLHQNQNVTPKMKDSALRFAVIFNLWLPIVGYQCFSSIEDLILFIAIPFILLILLYYIIAIRVKSIRILGNLNFKHLAGLVSSQIIASIIICYYPKPITLCIVGICFAIILYIINTIKNIKTASHKKC